MIILLSLLLLLLLRWSDLDNRDHNLLLLLLFNLLHLRIDLHDKVRIIAVHGHVLPDLFEFEELVVLFLINHSYLFSYSTRRKARRLSAILNFLESRTDARPHTTTTIRSTKETMSANERVCG